MIHGLRQCLLSVVLGGILLVGAVGAAAQVTTPYDSTSAVGTAPADSLEATALVDTSLVAQPAAGALEVEPPVNVWHTGVSPTAAVIMTPVFPGWGQLYAENSWRGALAFGVEMFYWSNMISKDRQAVRARDFALNFPADDPNHDYYNAVAEESWEQMRDWAWWSGGVLLIVALDAYVGAHLFEFDNDPVPVPNRWDDQFGLPGGDMPGGTPPLTVTVFQWRKTF
ncbi:hypothetical protein DRQ50_04275 [bacterium]|nr:MAG: hypothetical protein DRQ50_04275 [bacterium]